MKFWECQKKARKIPNPTLGVRNDTLSGLANFIYDKMSTLRRNEKNGWDSLTFRSFWVSFPCIESNIGRESLNLSFSVHLK